MSCEYIIVKKSKDSSIQYGEMMLLYPPVEGDKIYSFSSYEEALSCLESIQNRPIYASYTLSIRKMECMNC